MTTLPAVFLPVDAPGVMRGGGFICKGFFILVFQAFIHLCHLTLSAFTFSLYLRVSLALEAKGGMVYLQRTKTRP